MLFSLICAISNYLFNSNHWLIKSNIFLKARGQIDLGIYQTVSRMFSKNLLKQLPDGTTQIQDVA
jgi:hypothetical protein